VVLLLTVIGVVVLVPVSVLKVTGTFRAYDRLEEAAKAPTWSDLTGGAVTEAHRGPVIAFWAIGRLDRDEQVRPNPPRIFVCIDQVALVAIRASRVTRTSSVATLNKCVHMRQDHVPLRVTRRSRGAPYTRLALGSFGAGIFDDGTGMQLISRGGRTLERVTRALDQAEWPYQVDDAN
jgi:hypothetical protein